MGKRTARAAEMRRLLGEYQSSRQTRREFCEQNSSALRSRLFYVKLLAEPRTRSPGPARLQAGT
jgi:hypothetical protein